MDPGVEFPHDVELCLMNGATLRANHLGVAAIVEEQQCIGPTVRGRDPRTTTVKSKEHCAAVSTGRRWDFQHPTAHHQAWRRGSAYSLRDIAAITSASADGCTISSRVR